MGENGNFDWISEVKTSTEAAANLLVFHKKQPLKWSIVTDAAFRVLLFGLNGGLSSKDDLSPYFTVVNDKIGDCTLDEDDVFMLAIGMKNSSYFHADCCTNVPLKPIHTEILEEYSKKYLN